MATLLRHTGQADKRWAQEARLLKDRYPGFRLTPRPPRLDLIAVQATSTSIVETTECDNPVLAWRGSIKPFAPDASGYEVRCIVADLAADRDVGIRLNGTLAHLPGCSAPHDLPPELIPGRHLTEAYTIEMACRRPPGLPLVRAIAPMIWPEASVVVDGHPIRPGEIRSLTWADFHRETWTLRLHPSGAKTGHGRVLALVDELRAGIERRLDARTVKAENGTETVCPLIFHRAGRPMGEFRKAWKTACQAAGITGRRPYDLRRTAVRNMVRAGVDPAVAMRISGHRTRNVFDRYNIVDERDLHEAAMKTTAYVSALPTAANVVPLRPVAEAGR